MIMKKKAAMENFIKILLLILFFVTMVIVVCFLVNRLTNIL